MDCNRKKLGGDKVTTRGGSGEGNRWAIASGMLVHGISMALRRKKMMRYPLFKFKSTIQIKTRCFEDDELHYTYEDFK